MNLDELESMAKDAIPIDWQLSRISRRLHANPSDVLKLIAVARVAKEASYCYKRFDKQMNHGAIFERLSDALAALEESE